MIKKGLPGDPSNPTDSNGNPYKPLDPKTGLPINGTNNNSAINNNNNNNNNAIFFTEEVTFWFIIGGIIFGCLLIICFTWWYKELDSPCTMCNEFIDEKCAPCCVRCHDCCTDTTRKCGGYCRRSPEAIAAAKVRKHEQNKLRAIKKRNKLAKKQKRKEERERKKAINKNRTNRGDVELAEGKLAAGWEKVEDSDGNIFYWNEETSESSWVKPTEKDFNRPAHRATDTLMPAGWDFGLSEEYGQKFYINAEGESQWDRPPGNEHLTDNPMKK
jgi:hypothetical protein